MQTNVEVSKRKRGVWSWIAVSLLIAVIVLTVIVDVVMHRAEPILKGRVIETLSTHFDSRVEMDGFHVSVLKGLEVSGDGLRIFAPDDVVAAGAKDPLISLGHFFFHANLVGLFLKPMHVGTVHVTDMVIDIPPREVRAQGAKNEQHIGKIKIVVDEIVCDNSHLIIGTAKPDKDPKDFELGHIVMHNVGPNSPWTYDATLVNAIPRGDIHATGTFGPWVNESPGDSHGDRKYTFDHADLNTIKGIGGMLSSVGEFKGQLNRIEVDGTTETPDFSLDTANHKMPLHTEFHAIVDGTSGDTYLQPVDARLGGSDFTCKGEVINVKGRAHHRSGRECAGWADSGFSEARRENAAGGNDRTDGDEDEAAYSPGQRERVAEDRTEWQIRAARDSLYESGGSGQGGHAESAGAEGCEGCEAWRGGCVVADEWAVCYAEQQAAIQAVGLRAAGRKDPVVRCVLAGWRRV